MLGRARRKKAPDMPGLWKVEGSAGFGGQSCLTIVFCNHPDPIQRLVQIVKLASVLTKNAFMRDAIDCAHNFP